MYLKIVSVSPTQFLLVYFNKCINYYIQKISLCVSPQLSLPEDRNDLTNNGLDSKELVYLVQICCQVSLFHRGTNSEKLEPLYPLVKKISSQDH